MQRVREGKRARGTMSYDDVGILSASLLVFGVVNGSSVDLNLVMSNVAEDSCFEGDDFFFGHGVGFGDDGNEIDSSVKTSHEFYVDWFQSARGTRCERDGTREKAAQDERVTGGFDEVETGVNSVVDNLGAIDAVLLFEVGVVTSFDVVEDRFPSVCARMSEEWGRVNIEGYVSSLLIKSP